MQTALLNRDGQFLLAARILRSFGYGVLTVAFGVYLALLGLSHVQVGIVLATTLVGAALSTILASLLAERVGRRRMLVVHSGLLIAAGIVYAGTDNLLALLATALLGGLNLTGSDHGPFLALEQAIIPQTCTPMKRTLVFSLFSMLGTFAVAAGASITGLPRVVAPDAVLPTYRLLFLLYAAMGLVAFALYLRLSSASELTVEQAIVRSTLSAPSRPVVARLAVLFSLDAFAGGFVIQSFVAYWFFTTFHTPETLLAGIFATANILTAVSHLAAAPLAHRIGLVKTMVFTHLPSNLLLMFVPLMPTLPLALATYLARMSLSQLDVPTRQSYLAAIMPASDRVAAAGFTNIGRNLSQAVSPSLAGYTLQFVSSAAPFLLGGGLKAAYDLLLYAGFRRLKPPEELLGVETSAPA